MAKPTASEPFPDIAPAHSLSSQSEPLASNGKLHRRRKSSSLRGDPRGDATGPALATLYDRSPGSVAPSSQKTTPERPGRRSKRKRVKSFFRRWRSLSFRHTWLNPLIVCILVFVVFAINPTSSNPVHCAIFLSYPLTPSKASDLAAPLQYGKGAKDLAFVAFYTVLLSFTREFLMQKFLRPLAIRAGMKSRAKQSRFMEQMYTAIYFAVFGPFGLYVMSKTPVWYFNTTAMYEGFPHQTHDALFKAYYLLQASYWTQQMIVLLLMLEKPRKDFKELVAHHIITLSLIWLSYRFHFTYMGLAVYITHDISDFFLATSKVLNYIDSPIVIPYFAFFIGTWTYLRHYINIQILFSILPLPSPFPDHVNAHISNLASTAWTHADKVASPAIAASVKAVSPFATQFAILFPHTAELFSSVFSSVYNVVTGPMGKGQFASIGPYTLDWYGEQYKCWISQYITFILLASLQAVNIFWMFFIIRIVWRMLKSFGAEVADERSEYDSEEEEERKTELKAEADAAEAAATEKEANPTVMLNGRPVSP